MSEQITIVDARERLFARLWAGECPLNGDSCLAVSEHHLWRALREQRFHAEVDDRRLLPHDLTDGLRRTAFTKSPALLIDTDEFSAWVATVSPLTKPPGASYMTAVEAVSFLACGAFLTADDFAAITIAHLKNSGPIEVVGTPVDTGWELAERRLFDAHVAGKLTLIGRKAPRFGAATEGERTSIPLPFFADPNGVTLALFNSIHARRQPTEVWGDVMVRTSEFANSFLSPSNNAGSPSNDVKAAPKRRAPTRRDAAEFTQWAKELHDQRGYGASREEATEFARSRGLSREWAREQYQLLPEQQRRQRGGRGSAKYLSKARAAD